MTQEELDALMDSDDLDDIQIEEAQIVSEQHQDEAMVNQLSSVTIDSEKKATEIMTKLDQVLAEIDATEVCIKGKSEEKALIILDDVRNIVFDIMSVMQYQDIHRQKIERVMNTMLEISSLMSNTLNGVIPTVAPSAKHIDEHDGESIDDEELAKLIAQMGN